MELCPVGLEKRGQKGLCAPRGSCCEAGGTTEDTNLFQACVLFSVSLFIFVIVGVFSPVTRMCLVLAIFHLP